MVMRASTEGTEDILSKLDGLAKQASSEKSHYYVAATVGEAHREIVKLRAAVKALGREIVRQNELIDAYAEQALDDGHF